jgi:hypothetical protein
MKEGLRSSLEKAAKIWTVVTLPIEAYLIGHGIYAGSTTEVLLGAAGIVGDLFMLKWLKRDEKARMSQNPISNLIQRGSERFRTLNPFSRSSSLQLAAA